MLDTKVFSILASAILFWTTTDVVQGRYIYHSEINRWVKQDKVVATWEQAKSHCESEGAVLASPINEELIQYMTSLIDVDHHESPYFIGMKLTQNTKAFKSIEGILLDDLPEAFINKIDKLDPREGDCLGMSRSNILVVPCWTRLPYLCYLNTTTNSPIYEPTTTLRPVTEVQRSTTHWSSWIELSTVASLSSSLGEPTDCGFGYQRYSTGSCYKVHDEYKSWHKAESTCSNEGGYLAIINDANEAEFLKSISFRDNYEYIRRWIGLRERDGWRSVHGDRVDQIFNIWSATVSGFPCGVLKSDGLLDDQTCNFKYGFICEKSVQETSSQDTNEYTTWYEPSSTRSPPPTDPFMTSTTTLTDRGFGYEFNYKLGSYYKVHDEYKSWDEAESTCSNEGGYLAVINDSNEAEYLKSIASRPNDAYTRKWIGLREIDGDWRSVHGDHIDQIFNVWSNTVSGLPCGVLKDNGLLDDQSCTFKYRFICEISMQETSTIYGNTHRYESSSTRLPLTSTTEEYTLLYRTPDCGYVTGYQRYSTGSCYKVHDEYKSWYKAESTCSNEGGYLAIINDANEAEFLKSISFRDNYEYIRRWIGLRERDGWRSVHGDRVDQIFNIWSATVSVFPCGALKSDGLLDDQTCNFKYGFICERSVQETSSQDTNEYTTWYEPSSTRSPPPTDPFMTSTTTLTDRGSGYEFNYKLGSYYKVHDEYKSWDEAESTCSNEGGYLAIINDSNEAEYLKSIISRPEDDYIGKWIGLREIDGDWRSVHGDHIGQIFNVWSNTVSGLPCGVLKNDGLLDDQSCTFKYRFICEISMQETSTIYGNTHRYESSSTRLPLTSTTEESTLLYRTPDCGYGYKFHFSSCYNVHEEYKSWDEAEMTCASEAGYLAIINDADEAQVLQSISSLPNDKYRRKWIGLRETNGDWRSIQDNSLDQIFHIWSDSVSGLPCGALKDDGTLDDQSCDFKYRFICEKHPYYY